MSQSSPLLVVWSTTDIRIYDPNDGSESAELGSAHAGRNAVILISQRCSFVRSLSVPSLSKAETRRALEFKLGDNLPIPLSELVWGFQLRPAGSGRVAIVGAVRADWMRTILELADQKRLKVLAIVPQAFCSWLEAQKAGKPDVAVVWQTPSVTTIDIVSDGSLRASRTVPRAVGAELDEEIAEACDLASVDHLGSIVATPCAQLGAIIASKKADLPVLELPEVIEARETKAVRLSQQRSVVAAVAALAFAGFAIQTRLTAEKQIKADTMKRADIEKRQKETDGERITKLKASDLRLTSVKQALGPAQTSADVLSSLANDAPKNLWLTGVTFERGKPLTARGQAMTGQDVTAFVDQLSKDKRFRDAKVVFANKTMIEKKQIVEFGISAHVVGNFGIDREGSEVKS